MIEIKDIKTNTYKVICEICESSATITLEENENIISECYNHDWLVINGNGVLKTLCPFCCEIIAEESCKREEKHLFM